MGLASKMLVIVLAMILLTTGFTVTFGLIRGSIKPLDMINKLESFFTPGFYMIVLAVVIILVIISLAVFLLKQRFQI